MEMIVTVKQHGLDPKGIASSEEALQRNASPTLPPVRRDHNGQLNPGLTGQLFQFALVYTYNTCLGEHEDLHRATLSYTATVALMVDAQEKRLA
jgi:hypothetical protein